MTNWTTIRTIATRRFAVSLQCAYDTNADHASYDAATRAGIARGAYAPYVFRVVVLCDGREVGADYLGDSIYDNPQDFAREHYGIAPKGRAAGVTYCVYFPSMVRAAIAEARKRIVQAPQLRIVRIIEELEGWR